MLLKSLVTRLLILPTRLSPFALGLFFVVFDLVSMEDSASLFVAGATMVDEPGVEVDASGGHIWLETERADCSGCVLALKIVDGIVSTGGASAL